MRIIVLNDRRVEREAITKTLSGSIGRIDAVADERAAMDALTKEATDVLIVATPAKGGDDLVRRLRSRDATGQAYVLAILDPSPTHKELTGLLSAGMNDFLRRPVLDAELIERTLAPSRLLRWMRSLDKTVFDLTAAPELSGLNAWRKLGFTVAEDLSQIAGQQFSVQDGWPNSFGDASRGATIPMSLAGDQLEIRLSICLDAKSAGWVRSMLLGDASAQDPAVDDVLREFANTAGGALKRAALQENVTLTTGIPVNTKPVRSGQTSAWTLSLEDGGACFAITGEIIERRNQRVSATKLCEGMIVVNDVRSEGGVLLVRAGSRLTSTAATKLSSILGPRIFIEVAPAS